MQSQARFEAGQEAMNLGVKVFHEWSTRMINSRDTHIALNGKKAMQGEKFPGSMLRFPGAPDAPARETINCHCDLIPGVLLPDEELPDSSKYDTIPTWKEQYESRSILSENSLPNGLPIKAKPNSIVDKVDRAGKVLQRRVYGADGMAWYDIDTTDHGMPWAHPTGAHKNIFNYKKKNPHGPPKKFSKEDLANNSDIIIPDENYINYEPYQVWGDQAYNDGVFL